MIPHLNPPRLAAASAHCRPPFFDSGFFTMQVSKSNKLANVCYDIRGPVLKHAKRLEEEGQRILKPVSYTHLRAHET